MPYSNNMNNSNDTMNTSNFEATIDKLARHGAGLKDAATVAEMKSSEFNSGIGKLLAEATDRETVMAYVQQELVTNAHAIQIARDNLYAFHRRMYAVINATTA